MLPLGTSSFIEIMRFLLGVIFGGPVVGAFGVGKGSGIVPCASPPDPCVD